MNDAATPRDIKIDENPKQKRIVFPFVFLVALCDYYNVINFPVIF